MSGTKQLDPHKHRTSVRVHYLFDVQILILRYLALQHGFLTVQVDTVMSGMKQLDPQKRWPLLVLHSRRTKGPQATRALRPYRDASSFYGTPYGSNDDW
jgi:hypothetical protein